MKDYVLETIQSYNEYLGKVENGSEIIANLLREDQITNALSVIVDFSEGMSWLTKATELLRENNITVNLDISEINNFLEEINEGLKIQDYLLVADLFEYEIAKFFSNVQLVEEPKN